jgi:hypothetical protein
MMSATMNHTESPPNASTAGDVTRTHNHNYQIPQPTTASNAVDDGNSTDALADAFSSSLATIAAASRNNHRIRTSNHKKCSTQMSDVSPTITSTVNDHNMPVFHSLTKHVVSATANATTSSDERGDSTSEGHAATTTEKKLNMYDYTNCHRRVCHESEESIDSNEGCDRPHYHRHHHKDKLSHVNAMTTPQIGSTPLEVVQQIAPETESPLAALNHTSTTNIKTISSGVGQNTLYETDERTVDLQPGDESIVNRSRKRGLKRRIIIMSDANETKATLMQSRLSLLKHDRIINMNDVAAGDSSGMNSASDGGYSASYSSNGSCDADYYDSCNNSLNGNDDDDESTDESDDIVHRKQGVVGPHLSGDPMRPMLSKKHHQDSMSSDIADFSSNFYSSKARSQSHSMESSSLSSNSGQEKKVRPGGSRRSKHDPISMLVGDCSDSRSRFTKRTRFEDTKPAATDHGEGKMKTLVDGRVPIMALDCDVLANVLSFLEPPEVLDVLTMPLSKGWMVQYTSQPELWRVLCLLEPFKAQINDESDDSSGTNSSSSDDDSIFLHSFSTNRSSKYRLLYASYIRCMRCLARIKEDAVSGRPLSMIDYGAGLEASGVIDSTSAGNFGTNQNLQQFLARARTCTDETMTSAVPVDVSIPAIDSCNQKGCDAIATGEIVGQSQLSTKKTKNKFGYSKLTQRLVGPSLTGRLGEVELPWSYGIYSIVNWMVAYFDVEGIQLMCLRVLPFLLENEQQRSTAQRAGLTDIVLRNMVLFPESVTLHTAAFHTIVLLARPLGGQEGMLFHTTMVNSSGIFGSSSEDAVGGKSGIAVLIDSMRRFGHDEALQSMACWSLVNIALAPAQKEVLVKLGGIEAIAQAMVGHQQSAEVQFRALFALINLVIPSASGNNINDETLQDLGIDTTEREMLDEVVDQIINLVVLSMMNYCANEAILNRACLVLHNLSLSPSYHSAMIWTPNCYQMLEWCLGNYRTDQVLQQSAAGTLHRLQTTLSKDEALRIRFTAKLQEQQKASVARAK